MINPEENKWGNDKNSYRNSIDKSGFTYSNVEGAKSSRSASRGLEGDRGAGAEKTQNEQYQDLLKQAAAKGLPVVVVFGSQTAKDAQKNAETISSNIKEGQAAYLFIDTDRLDPNSDLGKVARRNQEQGQGLGAGGKSDLTFTGIYTIEQKQDGSLGLGKSVATFWGGRSEISDIMRDQLQYAKRATLNGGKPTAPDAIPNPKPDSTPDASDRRKPSTPPSDRNQPGPDSDDDPYRFHQERNQPNPADSDDDPYRYHQQRDRQRPAIEPDRDQQQRDQQQRDQQQRDQQQRDQQQRDQQQRDQQQRDQQQRDQQQRDQQQRDDQLRRDEARRKQEEVALQKRKQNRMDELREVAGEKAKNYTIDQYAEGWEKFLQRADLQEGPLRDVIGQFGQSMFTGEFDGKKLAESMNAVKETSQTQVDRDLAAANKDLAQSGLRLSAKVDPATGKISEIELRETANPGTTVMASADGRIISKEQDNPQKIVNLGPASMRLAKRSEPQACP